MKDFQIEVLKNITDTAVFLHNKENSNTDYPCSYDDTACDTCKCITEAQNLINEDDARLILGFPDEDILEIISVY